jgi:hypothetical protein
MQHIKRFIDRLNDLQVTNSKDFTMSMHEARLLHADITKLLIDTNQETATTANDVINVEIKGDSF